MFRRLQEHPHFLEILYDATNAALRPIKPWLRPGSTIERLFTSVERHSKGWIFDCRMCGQCVLHYTGMTCPMTCPKNLRNGPCGGVRPDGHCEVKPEMPCIWLQAWQRSRRMPVYGEEIHLVQPPHNFKLQDSSAWVNDLSLPEELVPKGWEECRPHLG